MRSIANKVYDKARSKTLEEMTQVYPELYRFLLEKCVAEYTAEDSEIMEAVNGDYQKAYDRARRAAQMQLKELRPGAWDVLMAGWNAHFRDELGFVDQRAEANRARLTTTARGDGGRFA